MNIGDIVVPKQGRVLRSGCNAYPAAIVVSMEPFILVSEDADMRWSSTVSPEEFNVCWKGSAKHIALAKTRLKS